ncbi:MFS transporter [Desulfocurvus sp. DL9XJH121]
MSASHGLADDAPLALRRALPCLLIFAGLFFVNFLTRVSLAPFLPHIEAEFDLSHAQSGALFFYVCTGTSVSMLLSGLFARALGHRRTILVSTVGIGLGLVGVSLSSSLSLIHTMLVATGLAAGLYFPSAIASITALLTPRHWGRGLAIHELAPNSAFVAAPALAALLEGVVPWRTVFAGLGAAALAMGLLFALRGRGGNFRGQAPRLGVILGQVLRRPAFWVLTALFALASAASFGPYSMLSLYFTDEVGMDVEWANAVLTASRLSGPILVLMAGHIVDGLGARGTVALALGGAGALTALLGLLPGWGMTTAAILQPAMAAAFFPAGLTAASMVFPKDIRNIAVSLIVPSSVFVGSGLTPPALGWFGDRGDFATGFVCLGGLVVTGAVLAWVLPKDDAR